MAWEQGTVTPEHLNLSELIEHLDCCRAYLLHGLGAQEAATVLQSLAAIGTGLMLKPELRAWMDALQQELSETKGRLTELVTRLQSMPEEPAQATPPPSPPAAKSRRRRRPPEIGWNVSPKLMKALDDARTRHGFPHRRALVEYFLALHRRRRAGHDIIIQCLDEDEPKRGPRKRLHFRGLLPHHRRQVTAEAARAELPERLFIAGLCWWGLSLLTSGEATPMDAGPHDEGRTGAY